LLHPVSLGESIHGDRPENVTNRVTAPSMVCLSRPLPSVKAPQRRTTRTPPRMTTPVGHGGSGEVAGNASPRHRSRPVRRLRSRPPAGRRCGMEWAIPCQTNRVGVRPPAAWFSTHEPRDEGGSSPRARSWPASQAEEGLSAGWRLRCGLLRDTGVICHRRMRLPANPPDLRGLTRGHRAGLLRECTLCSGSGRNTVGGSRPTNNLGPG
jgi:hypothetical protein